MSEVYRSSEQIRDDLIIRISEVIESLDGIYRFWDRAIKAEFDYFPPRKTLEELMEMSNECLNRYRYGLFTGLLRESDRIRRYHYTTRDRLQELSFQIGTWV